MDNPTPETAALFNSFDNAMTSGLNDLIETITTPGSCESSVLSLMKSTHVADVFNKPTKRRAPLRDVLRKKQ